MSKIGGTDETGQTDKTGRTNKIGGTYETGSTEWNKRNKEVKWDRRVKVKSDTTSNKKTRTKLGGEFCERIDR